MRAVRFFQWMGIVLLLGVVIALFGLNFPLFRRGTEVVVSVDGKVCSQGIYYQGTLPYGVFIVGDVGEDQYALKSLAQDYYGSGASVMTMDLSGHGSSVRGLDRENVSDQLLQEVQAGLEVFRKKSELEDNAVLLVGHGYGARAILQILAAGSTEFRGASLISPYVLLDGGDGLEGGSVFLSGKADDSKTGWGSALNAGSISVPVQLIASEKDDVVPYTSVQELYRRMSGSSVFPITQREREEQEKKEKEKETASKAMTKEDGEDKGEEKLTTRIYNVLINGSSSKSEGTSVTSGSVTLTLVPSAYHSYQVFSNGVISASKIWAHSKAGMRTVSSTSIFPLLRMICWCMAAAGLVLVGCCSMALAWSRYPGVSQDRCGVALYPWRSLIIRLLIWAAGGLIGLLLWLVFLLLPYGEPAGRLMPAAFAGGYGVSLLLLYVIRRMPGASGSIQTFTGTLSIWRTGTSIAILAVLCALIWFLGESGLYQTVFNGARVFWTIVFTAVMAVGFYGIELDADVFSDNNGGLLLGFLHRLVILLPFLLVFLVQWMTGSYSQALQFLHSLLALTVCLYLSAAFHRHSGARMIPAAGAAFLYSMMVIPSAVLVV